MVGSGTESAFGAAHLGVASSARLGLAANDVVISTLSKMT